MTSISSINQQQARPSPRDMLQSELNSEVASGQISSSDQSALSNALDSIDASLRAGRSSSGGRPSPGEMQSKINDLIEQQVQSGALTEGQANELKGVFANAISHGRPGGPGGPGGPPPSGSSTNSNNAGSDDGLQQLLKALQNAAQTSGYNVDGTTASLQSSLVVNYQT